MVSGGFPCQDISVSGLGDGLDGERSGRRREYVRIIGDVRPDNVFVENSRALTFRGGGASYCRFYQMGYDCRWGMVSASDAIWLYGTPRIDHLRNRIWIRATSADAIVNEDAAGAQGAQRRRCSRRPSTSPWDNQRGVGPWHSESGWVEWLMGWPVGRTASAPLATDRFRLWLNSHGISSKPDA